MNLAPARALIPDTDTDFTTKYICAVKYQTLEILWHAAINVPRAWLVMTRRFTGVRNMTLSDTPRFPTRRVPICDSSGIVKYHSSKNSISFHAVQGKKHIPASQIIEGWVNHDTLSRSGLYIIYYQTSFVSFRSWICNKTIMFHWFYKFDSKLR